MEDDRKTLIAMNGDEQIRLRKVIKQQDEVLQSLARRLDNAEDELQEARELIKELARNTRVAANAAATSSSSDRAKVAVEATTEGAVSSSSSAAASASSPDLALAGRTVPAAQENKLQFSRSPSSKVHPQVTPPSESKGKNEILTAATGAGKKAGEVLHQLRFRALRVFLALHLALEIDG